MHIANPLFLWAGVGLLALPIVLHLIMRRKPRHFEFPALRFIQQRHHANRRWLRLRHLLLLALRMAAIFFFAAALARPSMKLSGPLGSQKAPVAAALVFDTSMRMEYAHQNQTRLEAAREWGLWLLAQLPRDSQVAVLDSRLGPGAFQIDRGAATHRVQRLETVANSQPLSSVLEEALRVLSESELTRREVYVFTDMARVSWPTDTATRLESRIAELEDVGIYVIDVGVDKPTNSALGELRLSGQALSNRSPLEIETELFHTGPDVTRTVEVYLLEDDSRQSEPAQRKLQKRSQQIVTLKPDESRVINFDIGGLEPGTHQGYVELAGADGLACDDRRYFTVEVKPAWRVLIAAPEPAERYAWYLPNALAPASYRRSGRAQFECEVVTLDELFQRSLQPYSAVCVLDPTPLRPVLWEKLTNYASDGHGVAIFLGRNAKPVGPFNEPAAQELLAGKLLRQARSPDWDCYLAPRDFQHPILAWCRGKDQIPWDTFPVARYWQLGQLAKGVDVVVPFADGRPAILERPLGRGRAVVMTTPISDSAGDPESDAWNSVGQSWPFFVLVNQMMSYLVGSSDQQLNYFAGQTAILRLDPQQEFRSYVLTAPDDVEVRMTPDLAQHVLVVASTDRVGNYRVKAGGTASGVDRGFSVNLASEQTQMERLADEELSEVFGPADYRVARDRDELEGKVSVGRVGRELFPLLILLVAAVLGVEHVAANRFYRE